MKSFMIFIVVFLTYLFTSTLYANELIHVNGVYYTANGKYYIEKDEKGVFIRTDKHGFWYLEGDALSVFKVGESGSYFMEKGAERPYIITDKKKLLYVNQQVVERLNQKTSESDAEESGAVEVIIGNEKYWTNPLLGGIYVTEEEARRGIKGKATREWEKRKEAEAQALWEAQQKEQAKREVEQALWEAEQARRQALWEAEQARREAEQAREEAERARRRARNERNRRYEQNPMSPY